MPGRVSARPGLTPGLSQNSRNEFQQFSDKSCHRAVTALFLSQEKCCHATAALLPPLLAHDSTPFAAC
jgi:hypothetical protein